MAELTDIEDNESPVENFGIPRRFTLLLNGEPQAIGVKFPDESCAVKWFYEEKVEQKAPTLTYFTPPYEGWTSMDLGLVWIDG